jgi:hypothetical protein
MALTKRFPVSKNFFLDEYVNQEFYTKWGETCIWWIRPELIRVDQFIRDRFNTPIHINTWATGGSRKDSGLRYPTTTVGAGDSMHKFGCASDLVFEGKPNSFYDEVREDIKKNWKNMYKPLGLTTIEADTQGWLHKDVRNILNQTELFIVPIPK